MDYDRYKGQPFQVISKLQVRYTGIFQDIDQESQTLCLSEVYNHGTEDRPAQRALPGSTQTLGWVRFHTNSIHSLALLENYVPPSEQIVDPILASVSGAPQANNATSPPTHGLASLPPKPQSFANSAHTALDRVQQSLSELSTDSRPRRKAQPPAVPDAEFDFTKGNERFQKERQARKEQEDHKEHATAAAEPADLGEPEKQPHPSAIVNLPAAEEAPSAAEGSKPARKTPAYSKSSFFDNISSDSSRVSRAEERHRNLDTFGEAGGADAQAYGARFGQQGGRGGRGGRGGPGGGGRGGHRGRGAPTPAWMS